MAEERVIIGRYTAENGPTCASKHLSKLLRKSISEPSAGRYKNEYLLKLNELLKEKPSMTSGAAGGQKFTFKTPRKAVTVW